MRRVNKNTGSSETPQLAAQARSENGDTAFEGIEIEQINHAGLNARVIKSRSGDALIEFLDKAGKVTNTAFYPHLQEIMCFTPATMIMTPNGPRHAGELMAGDLIVTRDNGAKALAWIGKKSFGIGNLIANPALAPVTIAPGALGQGRPENALVVSPNHRILIRENTSGLMLNAAEVLVSAQDLVGRPGITQTVPNAVTYLHLMFEQHELVISDGAWSESFQPTNTALQGIDAQQKSDLCALFPALDTETSPKIQRSVRPDLRAAGAMYLPEIVT